jgi:hypothetical protein
VWIVLYGGEGEERTVDEMGVGVLCMYPNIEETFLKLLCGNH